MTMADGFDRLRIEEGQASDLYYLQTKTCYIGILTGIVNAIGHLHNTGASPTDKQLTVLLCQWITDSGETLSDVDCSCIFNDLLDNYQQRYALTDPAFVAQIIRAGAFIANS